MNVLQKLFYTGTRCSRCGSSLQSAKGLSLHQQLELEMDSAYECNKCHNVVCGTCHNPFSFSGCSKCGGTNFTVTTAVKG